MQDAVRRHGDDRNGVGTGHRGQMALFIVIVASSFEAIAIGLCACHGDDAAVVSAKGQPWWEETAAGASYSLCSRSTNINHRR